MLNKKEYPLAILEDAEKVFSAIRQITSKNINLIEIIKDEDFKIIVKDSDLVSTYQFKVSNPELRDRKCFYNVEYNPANRYSGKKLIGFTMHNGVIVDFNNWINLINSHNKANPHPEGSFYNIYRDRFFERFNNIEIIDEDAETEPFSNLQQVFIYNYFVFVIEVIKKKGESDPILLEAAEEIRDNVANWPKKKIISKWSEFLAKTQQKGIGLLNEILSAFKKEGIKRLASGSLDNFDKIGDWISKIGEIFS